MATMDQTVPGDPVAEHGKTLETRLKMAEDQLAIADRTMRQWQPVAQSCRAALTALAQAVDKSAQKEGYDTDECAPQDVRAW
jgi:hypothetical protein